jgi:hypothetical protein
MIKYEGDLKMISDEGTEGHYPRVFVCTFCRKEFEMMSSVFSHMKEQHDPYLKSE